MGSTPEQKSVAKRSYGKGNELEWKVPAHARTAVWNGASQEKVATSNMIASAMPLRRYIYVP